MCGKGWPLHPVDAVHRVSLFRRDGATNLRSWITSGGDLMALYHFSAGVVKRSAGRSAVAASAYRSGEQLLDERYGLSHDYTRKQGITHAEIMAPDNAPEWMRDRAQLWNAVEKIETRKNAQLARDITLALPFELSDDQRRDLVRQFVAEQFVSRGMIADIAIHAPHRQGDDRNHHAHVMLTMRELTGDGFHDKKATPEARRWNERATLEAWRAEWAAIQNREFERLGIEAKVDHRSLDAQGIDREPQQHEGVVVTNMKRRGEQRDVAQENERRAAANDNRADLHAELLRVRAELERVRREQAALVVEKSVELSSEQTFSTLELERRQDTEKAMLADQLDQHYRPHLATVEAQARALTDKLEHPGFVLRVLRDLTGRTRADREKLEALQATIDNAHQRMQEQRDALAIRHAQEREQAARAHRQRQEQLARDVYEAQRSSATEAAQDNKPKLSVAQRLAARAERLQERKEALEQKSEQQQGNERKRNRGRDFDM